MVLMHNVVIVGGGPAGLSAALAAAAAGAPVLLIDSNSRLGGQYWRNSASDSEGQNEQHFGLATGLILINAVKARKEIEVWSEARYGVRQTMKEKTLFELSIRAKRRS